MKEVRFSATITANRRWICNEKVKLIALLLIGGNVLAASFHVHYNVRGSGRDVTVQADSSAEARRTVMDIFPGAVVIGVHRVE